VQDKIVKTAFDLFQQNGIKSVSMDDICRQMSISKKTLYKWFDNKDAIVHSAIENYLKYVQCSCETQKNESKNALHELFLMMDMMKEVFSKIHPSIFYDLKKYHPETWNLWVNHKCDFIREKVKENLQRGMEEKLYRADLDVEILSRLRVAYLDIAFDQNVFPASKFQINKVQLACLEHFMLGISTLKGHKMINKYRHVAEEE
jgi:AcrR family transcriptional regulator